MHNRYKVIGRFGTRRRQNNCVHLYKSQDHELSGTLSVLHIYVFVASLIWRLLWSTQQPGTSLKFCLAYRGKIKHRWLNVPRIPQEQPASFVSGLLGDTMLGGHALHSPGHTTLVYLTLSTYAMLVSRCALHSSSHTNLLCLAFFVHAILA
jgi:hypothetical protein